MADYFTNFSFIVPLKDDAQKQYALTLSQTASSGQFEETKLPTDFPAPLKDVIEDWAFEVEGAEKGIWINSSSGGIDAVCAFVQHLLQKFNTAPFVSFEWSHDCTKPRIDAYGGGAAIITKTTIKTMNTAELLKKMAVET